MAMPRLPSPGHVSVLHATPMPPAHGLPQGSRAGRVARTHDRSGHDRTAQRAATLLMLARMHRLDPDDPEHRALRERVIAEYMSYARHLAARYAVGGQASEDLCQVAYVGLIKSVDGFNPDYGATFLGYATPTILGELKRHFRDSSWAVHVPRRIQELSSQVRPITENVAQRLHRDPTIPELAALLGTGPREVLDAIKATGLHYVDSLDLPVSTDQSTGVTHGDLLGAEDPGMQNVVDRETLRPLLARLPVRDKRILHLSFFRGMTQEQIGAELGVTQMQVSRLLSAILQRLRLGADSEAAS
jgi:RNA polymerase sigma-B factor